MTEHRTDTILKQAFPKENIAEELKNQLQSLNTAPGRIGIACSSGADSVFLTRWFIATFPALKDRTTLLHFNHRTRGEDSKEDARFVAQLANTLGVDSRFGEHTQNPCDIATDEASLRQARMQFFLETWNEAALGIILTAHHMDDRAESLLMRLSRASSLDGLIAPKAYQQFQNGMQFGRPLLALQKSEILAVLHQIHQNWREDTSNSQNTYYRNFIRNKLLPIWNQRQPDTLIPNIAKSLNHLAEDAEVLNNLARSAVQSIDLKQMAFPIQQIKEHPNAIVKRCLWIWLNTHRLSGNLGHDMIDRLSQLVVGDSYSISADWRVERKDLQHLQLQSTRTYEAFCPKQFCLGFAGILRFPDGKLFRSERIRFTSDLYNNISSGEDDPFTQIHLDEKVLKGEGTIRVKFWEEGMRYVPLGLNHDKKLKSCFIDRKIESRLRKRLPVICNRAGDILWVPGLLPSEYGRVTHKSKILLRLTYKQS